MKFVKSIFAVALCFFISSCHDILDKENLNAVDDRGVWNDPLLAEAFVSSIYAENLPGWDRTISSLSDDAYFTDGDAFLYGLLTENSVNYWPYGGVRGTVYNGELRSINTLLQNIDNGTITDALKNRLKGEAYFFRAWRYFEMAKRYGGVPLVLAPQKITDDLLVVRSSTTETINQVIADLDQAISLLPSATVSSIDNKGRVHRGTALALKGRVMLYWASPQFDPGQSSGRWQLAYNANRAAKDTLEAKGFGLYENFANIWITEMNKEVILVRRYEYPISTHNWSAATRPLEASSGAANANQPTWNMVQAFPMKDGRPITGHASYNETYFWQNRDPRFKATIVYNGAPYALSGQTGRIQYTYTGGEQQTGTKTGFYNRKAINESQSIVEAGNSDTDYIELRYAEVLLNLAEAANAIGNIDEAYTQMKAIRARAGIEPGVDNMYGLTSGMTQLQMQDAIMLERRIEFAFEGKRHWDLRRNRLFESALNGTRRKRMEITLKIPKAQWDQIKNTVNLETDYATYFSYSIKDADTKNIDWKSNYYFYAIPSEHLQLNGNLLQTSGWAGGTFDPLQ